MNQIQIITDPDQLLSVLASLMERMPVRFGVIPDDILELQRLKHKEYLTETEVEKLFGLKKATLRKRRFNGEGPAYSKDGERVLYSRRKVEQYLEARRQKTHDQP